MKNDALAWFIAAWGSLVVGGLAAQSSVEFLRWRIAKKYKNRKEPKVIRIYWLDWSLGVLERAIATALTICAPAMLGPFIGGWVALKFAANWHTRKEGGNEDFLAKHRLVAMVGSAVSFAIAILAGLFIYPHALVVWQK